MFFDFAGKAFNGTRVEGVCRKAVCNAYAISHHILDKVAHNIKQNIALNEDPFDDRTKANEAYAKQMHLIAGTRSNRDDSLVPFLFSDLHELDLSDEQLAAVNIPNSEDTLRYYAWLCR